MNPNSHILIKAGDKILPFVIPVTVFSIEEKNYIAVKTYNYIEPILSHLSLDQLKEALENCNTESILYSAEIKVGNDYYKPNTKERDTNCRSLRDKIREESARRKSK